MNISYVERIEDLPESYKIAVKDGAVTEIVMYDEKTGDIKGYAKAAPSSSTPYYKELKAIAAERGFGLPLLESLIMTLSPYGLRCDDDMNEKSVKLFENFNNIFHGKYTFVPLSLKDFDSDFEYKDGYYDFLHGFYIMEKSPKYKSKVVDGSDELINKGRNLFSKMYE